MAIAKQPNPTAIRMTSNIRVLPSSDARLRPQCQDDQEREAKMRSEDDAYFEDDIADARALGACLALLYQRSHSRSYAIYRQTSTKPTLAKSSPNMTASFTA